MNQLSLLVRAAPLLEKRLGDLEGRIRDGDESCWPEYLATVQALAAALAHTAPGAGGALLTTAQMAARLQISPKALLRRKKELEPIRLGKRGRAALRWAAR
jgi:hypothetical protein